MKHGKAPTRRQKIAITEAWLEHSDWLVVKSLTHVLEIVHRNTGTKRWLILNAEKGRRRR